MIKLLGIFLISSSVCVYGMNLSRKVKYTNTLREDIYLLLKAIERDIKFGCIPISRILASYTPITKSIEELLSSLSNEKNADNTIEENLQLLTENEREKLKVFFSVIGKSSCSEKELILCRNCIDFFEEINAKSKKDADTSATLYRKLGILGGIMTIIILI